MTALKAFGATAAVLVVGTPLATLCLVAAIYVHESIEARRYKRSPNGPGLLLERADDDTQELTMPEEWLR